MTTIEFVSSAPCVRLGLKGPRAAAWLAARGIATPAAPNSWVGTVAGGAAGAAEEGLLVARLGAAEFFLEDQAGVARGLLPALDTPPPGVYPVLREDAAFCLSGDGAFDVLAQVCNVDFAGLAWESQPVIMTLMVGVAVLVLPQVRGGGGRFRIWCDPTFGDYLGESVGSVVVDCGGRYRRRAGGILEESGDESD